MTDKTNVEGAEQAPSSNIPNETQPKKVIDITRLAGLKLWIATPMYGGNCNGEYMASIMNSIGYLSSLGVHVQFDALFNESLITRARNYCVDEFLRSGATHLMFIDSDIVFDREHDGEHDRPERHARGEEQRHQ